MVGFPGINCWIYAFYAQKTYPVFCLFDLPLRRPGFPGEKDGLRFSPGNPGLCYVMRRQDQ